MKKVLLIGCLTLAGASVVLVVVGVIAGSWRFFSQIRGTGTSAMPAHLESPAVLVGSGFLVRSSFLWDIRLGAVTDIVLADLDPGPGLELGIAGSWGALLRSEDTGTESAVTFSPRAAHVDIVDVEGDGVCEYMNRGSWIVDPSLLGHDGRQLWTYGGPSGVDDMCAGDVDGDGRLEFVVGFNGGGGVHLLDSKGNRKWQKPDGNVWHVEIMDADGDRKAAIVHSNAAGQMTVRDRLGAITRRRSPGGYFSEFSLCRWPSKDGREHALFAEGDTVWLFDSNGRAAAQFDAPGCGDRGHARGVPARIWPDRDEYFAVLLSYRLWGRSVLYVYDPAGALVYQEVLPQACTSIAALSLDGSGADTILVGGLCEVWQYVAGGAQGRAGAGASE